MRTRAAGAALDPIGKGPFDGERRQRRDQSGVLGQPDEVVGSRRPCSGWFHRSSASIAHTLPVSRSTIGW